jgi:death-on-curing protein
VTEPVFVTLEQVLRAHERSLRAFGGTSGLRDEGLLRSAIAQPLNDFYYGHADVFGIAAAYAFPVGQAQAFLDGNKRTAIGTALAFLEQNGVTTATNYGLALQCHDRHRRAPDLEERSRARVSRLVRVKHPAEIARVAHASAEH